MGYADDVKAAALEVVRDSRRRYANSVLAAMRERPRFQSIGRQQYVYVGDVAQILDQEIDKGLLLGVRP